MSVDLGSAHGKIILDTDGVKEAVKESDKSVNQINKIFAGLTIGALASKAASVAVDAIGQIITAGSDAEEMMGKFDVVFGDYAEGVIDDLDDMAGAVGRSKFELREMASTVQDTFVPLGFAREQASELSVGLTQLAVDVASFNNAADGDVMRDFQSAIVGNHETVRKYGIILSEVTINQELLRQGVEGGYKAATEQEKVQARLNLIMAGSSDAMGDAARTSGSWANQQRRLNSLIADAATEIGNELLPVLTPLLTQLGDTAEEVIPELNSAIKELNPLLEDTGESLTKVVKGLPDLLEFLGKLYAQYKKISDWYKELPAPLRLAIGGINEYNRAMIDGAGKAIKWVNSLDDTTEALEWNKVATSGYVGTVEATIEATEEATQATQDRVDVLKDLAGEIENASASDKIFNNYTGNIDTETAEAIIETQKEQAQAAEEYAAALEEARQAEFAYNEQLGAWYVNAVNARDVAIDLTQLRLDSASAAGLGVAQMSELYQTMGLVSSAEDDAAKKAVLLNGELSRAEQLYRSGEITARKYHEIVNKAFEAYEGKDGEPKVIIDEEKLLRQEQAFENQAGAIAEVTTKAGEAKDALGEVHERAIEISEDDYDIRFLVDPDGLALAAILEIQQAALATAGDYDIHYNVSSSGSAPPSPGTTPSADYCAEHPEDPRCPEEFTTGFDPVSGTTGVSDNLGGGTSYEININQTFNGTAEPDLVGDAAGDGVIAALQEIGEL